MRAFFMSWSRKLIEPPVVTVEVDVAGGGVLGCEDLGPEELGGGIGVGDGDVPRAGVGHERLIDGGLAGSPAPIGFQDEELGHEPAGLAAGEWAFVNDEGEAGDFVTGHDEIRKAPEAVEEIILIAAIGADRKRHEGGHVVEVELDQVGDDWLLVGARWGEVNGHPEKLGEEGDGSKVIATRP